MADGESQEDELLAIASIYDERIFSRSSEEKGGQFNVFLDLPRPFQVQVHPRHMPKNVVRRNTNESQASDDFELLDIHYLPPVVLNFRFPDDYPSVSPPQFTISCKWLTVYQLSQLCKSLDEIWEESGPGEVTLFRWIQFLLDETLTALHVESPFTLHIKRGPSKGHKLQVDKRAIQDVGSCSQLVAVVLEYDQFEKKRVFESSYFTCNVCLSEKAGSGCIEFHGCGHVYCCECMAGYFKVQIEDGAVRALVCPSDKCESQALPSQVQHLVSPDLFAKYDRFLLQSSLDGMSDVMYCPRPSCQSAVVLDKESSMGVCASCSLAFCAFCKRAYHGVSPCRIPSEDFKKLWGQYLEASDEEKHLLEQRYGKRQLKRVFEEIVSEEWLSSNSKPCPSCGSHIQKIDGCNKMTCTKCRSYFCWICMHLLFRSDPYMHFNDRSSPCFSKLFEGMDMNDIDDDDWQ